MSRSSIAALAAVALASAAHAQIQFVSPNTLVTNRTDTFSAYQGQGGAGQNYDSIIIGDGVRYGERFLGQTISANGTFDVVNGSPQNPLTIAAGRPSENLSVLDLGSNNALTGVGPLRHPNFDAIGEGAVAIFFDANQFEMGITLAGAEDSGEIRFAFYRRDGSFIQTLTRTPSNGALAFRRDGNVTDIAGVVITNTDPAGLGLDDVRYFVPGPSAAALGLIASLAAARRRRL